ncbi:MAG: glutamate 5-kinase [Angustibacter sp.]
MSQPPDPRPDVSAARRIVVKIGSSSLTRPDGQLDDSRINALVTQVAARIGQGVELVLVSSGAIAAGLAPLGLSERPRDLATQQAAASVGQGRLVAHYARAFAAHGVTVGQVLLTADDVTRRRHYLNARQTLTRLLQLGVLPVVNENDTVATAEIRFGDNDRLAALVAHLVQAELLILLTDVDALYTGPPKIPGARRIARVSTAADLAEVTLGRSASRIGTGGMVTKVEAAQIAAAAGIGTVLTSAAQLAAALAGDDIGTWFEPTQARTASRQLWLAHATTAHGRLFLDAGAIAAVVTGRRSLLAAGIIRVDGEFTAGDPVDLCDQSGNVVARGLVNYASTELPELLGRSTWELARELGPAYEREVVHRDDLAVGSSELLP